MALIGKPKIVILDNPLDNVDPISKLKLIQTIREYTKDSTLFLATHDCNIAELLCERIAIMRSGKIMAKGTCNEIIEKHG